MADVLTPSDFSPWGYSATDPKLVAMVADVMSQAKVLAPCITDPAFPYADAAKGYLRAAVLRRMEAGNGGLTTRQQGAGPFQSMEVIDQRSNLAILRPTDIADLQSLCRAFQPNDAARAGALNMDPNRELPTSNPFWYTPDPNFQYNITGP